MSRGSPDRDIRVCSFDHLGVSTAEFLFFSIQKIFFAAEKQRVLGFSRHIRAMWPNRPRNFPIVRGFLTSSEPIFRPGRPINGWT
jgi:hypothetical protein